jgi:prephenate dehydrogenase
MEDDFRLQNAKIVIVGLGLMGGSLALALRGKCAALYGLDTNQATLELALDQGIVDRADSDPALLSALPPVDLVILAVPVPRIIDLIQNLPSFIANACIVFDLGSTKRDILQAMLTLPQRFEPIGGHPVCGKERLGLANADRNLYEAAPFVVTPLERTTRRAKSAVVQIISAIGAHLIEMTAEEHDRILATTSHLPFLLASALAHSTSQEFSALIGSGFRSTSRVAGTPSHMMMGVLQTNRENILTALQSLCNSLKEIESALREENYIQLESLLNHSRSSYQALVNH